MNEEKTNNGFKCFHCLSNTVSWCGDFDFEDYGYEGEGIVQVCHCSTCGAEIEYKIHIGKDEETEDLD